MTWTDFKVPISRADSTSLVLTFTTLQSHVAVFHCQQQQELLLANNSDVEPLLVGGIGNAMMKNNFMFCQFHGSFLLNL